MIRNEENKIDFPIRRIICFFLIGILVLSHVVPVKASERTVRVGFPIQEGLTEKTEDGRYTGYTVDYLNEIAKYTGWNIEYVEVDGDLNTQIMTLMQWLQEGKIDILGTMVYSDSLSEIYDYSGYSYGTSYSTICVRQDDYRWVENDYADWNHMRIGYTKTMKARFELLDSYAKMNNFTYEKVVYDSEEEIYEKLKEGEIDAVVSVDISVQEGTKPIARFSAKPYYFAITKGATQLLSELNKTMADINSSNPYFLSSLYEKYFIGTNDVVVLTKKQKDYIREKKKVRVLVQSDSIPLQYMDSSGLFQGISNDVFDYILEKTGLQFEFIEAQSEEEATRLIKEKKVDLISGFSKYNSFLSGKSYRLSLPYLKTYVILAMREGSDKENLHSYRLGITNSEYEYFANSEKFNIDDIKLYVNAEKCLDALLNKEIDLAYVDEYSITYFKNSTNKYDSIETLPYTEYFETEYSIAIIEENNDENVDVLASILNTVIHSMDDDILQSIIYKNANIKMPMTWSDFIAAHRIHILTFFVVLLLIVVLVLINIYRQKVKRHMLLQLEHSKFNKLASISGEIIFEYQYKTEKFHIFMQKKEDKFKLEEFTGLKECLEEKISIMTDNTKIIERGGRYYSVILEIIRVNGNEEYAIGKLTDVSHSMIEKENLIQKAQRDGMTNLYNPSVTKQMAKDAWQKNTTDIVAIIDIDHFKQINDTYGHTVGDKVIIQVARHLYSTFHPYGIIGRIGGDEFMLYLNDLTNQEEQKAIFSQFQKLVAEDLQEQYGVTLSIGVASSKNCHSFVEQFEKADKALYEVKEHGRNNISYNI